MTWFRVTSRYQKFVCSTTRISVFTMKFEINTVYKFNLGIFLVKVDKIRLCHRKIKEFQIINNLSPKFFDIFPFIDNSCKDEYTIGEYIKKLTITCKQNQFP